MTATLPETSRSQRLHETQHTSAPAQTPRPASAIAAPILRTPVEAPTPATANVVPTPSVASPSRAPSSDSATPDAHDHLSFAGSEQASSGSAAMKKSETIASPLADPLLSLLADVREDAQHTRLANENRLRQLTRHPFVGTGSSCEQCGKPEKDGTHGVDKDGVLRGVGLDERHPDVARLAALVQMLKDVERQATLNLNRQMRKHPLGPWCKAQRGIGHNTLPARLLAILGDPYINVQTGEPRTVGQLLAYCGHGDPARKRRKGMTQGELFALGNPDAKKVVYLIAESCMKQGGTYRAVYDKRKAETEGREHADACVRCGPSGRPAPAGSPWSDAHRHADALRITGKQILRDLWAEAKRLNEEQGR